MINLFEYIDTNEAGLKERFLNGIVKLYNKLSADEANSIRTKFNEIIPVVNSIGPPLFPDFKIKFKGEGNSQLDTLEVGDIVYGFYESGVIWENAVYNGGDPTDKANYTKIEASPLKTLALVLDAPQQVFELPEGAVCEQVYVNESFVTNTSSLFFISRWQQAAREVTLSADTFANNRVVFLYR